MGNRPFYGVIGNGETCAFISPLGNIEWLCLPQFDGNIVYSKAVTSMGGSLDMHLHENGRHAPVLSTKQEYIDETAVLNTQLKFKKFNMKITDFMPWPEPEAMDWEKRMIFRIVTIRNRSKKTVKISLKVFSNAEFGRHREVREGKIVASDGYAFSITFLGNKTEHLKIKPSKSLTIPVVLVYGKSRAEVKRTISKRKMLNTEMQLIKCINFWHNWFGKGYRIKTEKTMYKKAYYSSMTAIKLMNFERTGAMLAAATTSLPASPVGTHSWDYRFMWVRDSYYACRAFLETGHFEEVKKQLALFFRVQGRNGHWESPFYTIDGKVPGEEIDVDIGSETLRLNNAAKDQLQLDTEGSVIYTMYLYALYSNDLGFVRKNWNKIKAAANWVAKNYSREENGIWEFRHKTSHWIYGKVMCYLALNSAIKIAELLKVKYPKNWKKTGSKIVKEVLKNGWSAHRKAFLQSYERDSSMDISALALEDYGLIKPSDKRMKSTARAMEQKLNMNGGIKRNEDAQLPFYFSTLWLASHYIKAGETKKAAALMRTCIESSTDLYLCAEHFDAKNKIQYGNFPQTFNASMMIERIMEIENKGFEIEKVLGILNKSIKWAISFDTEELIKWSDKSLEYKEEKNRK